MASAGLGIGVDHERSGHVTRGGRRVTDRVTGSVAPGAMVRVDGLTVPKLW